MIGEVHNPKKPDPVENPRWLVIPDRGLFTGIAVFGAIGTGKSTGCMYPFAKQLLSYRAQDKDRRVGGLILEVKGDFCYHVKRILEAAGRGEDYVEISLDSPYRYNPLHNDLDAYALAYGISSLLNNLFGKSREPFWQQAYTNLVKFIILLHKILYEYVTLFDVYECVINPDRLEEKIRSGEASLPEQFVLIAVETFMAERDLETYAFERDPETGDMKAPRHRRPRRLSPSAQDRLQDGNRFIVGQHRGMGEGPGKAATVRGREALVLPGLETGRATSADFDCGGHLGVPLPVR